MTRTLTFDNIVSAIRKKKARSAAEVLMCGFTLRYVDSGRYRNVYHIVGSDYLVKIPIWTNKRSNDASKAHAKAEYAAYRRIKKAARYKVLQPLMMEEVAITAEGVMVVRKYRSVGRITRAERTFKQNVAKLAGKLFNGYVDLHDANYMRDADGNLKIIDLGYFLRNKDFKGKK